MLNFTPTELKQFEVIPLPQSSAPISDSLLRTKLNEIIRGHNNFVAEVNKKLGEISNEPS